MSSHDGGWATPGWGDVPPPPPPPPSPPLGSMPPPPPGVPGPQGQRVGLVPLYPMGVGDILDTSFKMLRAAALPAALVVLLVLGPLQVLASAGFQSPFTALSQPVPEVPDAGLIVMAVLAGLASLVLLPLVQAAMTWLGAHATPASAPSWRDALRAGANRYWATLGAFALLFLVLLGVGAVVALGVGAIALVGDVLFGVVVGGTVLVVSIVALIGVLVLGYLAVPCIVVEHLGPAAGIARAWRLLRARFWPTLGISLLVGLLVTILGSAVSSAISVPAFFGFPGSWAFIAIGGILDQLIRVPLGAFAALTIHVDQRIRTEGYDVAVLVSELRR